MALIFIFALLIIALIFFAAMLIYGTREKSFEQAIEEQRSKNFDLLLSGGSGKSEITTGKKESKKTSKKSKDTGAKKNKDKSTVTQTAKNAVTAKEQSAVKNSASISSAPVARKEVVNTVEPVIKAQMQPTDFVDQAPAATSSVPAPSSKAPQQPKETAVVSKKSEHKAAKQLKQQQQPMLAVVAEPVVVEKVATALVTAAEPVKPKTPEPQVQPVQQQQHTPKSGNKKSKRSISKGKFFWWLLFTAFSNIFPIVAFDTLIASPKELSFEDILELVNSSYFSADDVTRLTDALLNRQADDQNADYNWHKVTGFTFSSK